MNQVEANALSNPFPGLRPFRDDEEHLFFGRESQVDSIIDKLASARFLAVVGTSGSGKSSLVNCGLRPALHRGLMSRAGTSWRVAQFRPGSHPVAAMTAALAADGVLYSDYTGTVPVAEIIETSLQLSKRGLIDACARARLPEGVNLLVVVDQFEELFRFQTLETSAEMRDESGAFVNLLLETKRQSNLPIFIVLTMRSDFLGNCAEFPGLPEAINQGQYLVPRMSREERRAAITGPVRVGGAEISPVLLTRLVNDVGDNPDQLSILQHALNRTWAYWQFEGCANGPIALPHYESIGTMAHALDRHAEKAFGELSSERDRQICEKVFKALTDKGTDTRGIRRPASLGALCLMTGASQSEVTNVIDVFRKQSRSFLMPPLPETLRLSTIIDISHESLMRVWSRLRDWADEEAQSAQLYRRLSESASLHSLGKAGPWRDPELQVALDWRKKEVPVAAWSELYGGGFDATMSFLAESEAIREKEILQREQHQQRALEYEKAIAIADEQKLRMTLQQKSARRLRALLFALAVLFVAAVIASIWALRLERRAEEARRESKARELAALAQAGLREDPERSILLGMEAVGATTRFGQPVVPAAEDALQLAILSLPRSLKLSSTGSVNGIAFSPDGERIVTGGSDGTARVWDASDGHVLLDLRGHTGRITSISYSPDGVHIATASEDGTARQWSAETGEQLLELRRHSGAVRGVAYSADSSELATAGADGTVKTWDARDGRLLSDIHGHSGVVNGTAFDPKSTRIAAANADGTIGIWNYQTGALLLTLSGHSGSVNSVAFSPNGKILASASADSTARLWDTSTGLQIRNMRQPGAAMGVAFSPDGKRLATASSDKTASLWDTDKGLQLLNLREPGPVIAVCFSPNGKRLATGDANSGAQIWDLDGGHGLLTLHHLDSVNDVAYSPDGKWLITASSDKTAKLWDAINGNELLSLKLSTPVNGIAFSRDGTRVATGSVDGVVRVWDAAAGQLRLSLKGHNGPVNGLTFNVDNRRLASAGADGNAIEWDTITGQQLLAVHHSSPVNFAVYSPDGKLLATASSDGTAKVWNAATGDPVLTLHGSGGSVLDVAYSPDGQRLITANADNSVTIWNANTGEQIKSVRGHAGSVLAVASSPDDKHFATASQDGTVKLWDEMNGEVLQTIQGDSGAVNSVAFSPDGQRIVSASTAGTVQVYTLNVTDLLNLARSRLTRNLTAEECAHYFQAQECPPLP
jgi:WD40 repeat protein